MYVGCLILHVNVKDHFLLTLIPGFNVKLRKLTINSS